MTTPSREAIAQVLSDTRRARRGYSPQPIKYHKEAERNGLLADADTLIAAGFIAAKPADDGVREATARKLEEYLPWMTGDIKKTVRDAIKLLSTKAPKP